jgi:hypothetical protein
MEAPRAPVTKLDDKSGATIDLSAVPPPSAPATTRGPQRGDVAAPPSEEKPDLHTLLERCRSAALAVKQLKSNFRKIADQALESIYRLHLLSLSDPAAKQALELEYKEAKVRRSKNTTTEFTLLIKLFFGKLLPRPTVSRWSSTLQLALEKKQKPQDLVAFIREKGGTAACAHLLAQQRHEDTKGAVKNPQSTAMRVIEERLADAPKIKLPKGLGIGGKGLFELLVKPQADGSCAVVGQRQVEASAVRRFAPMAAKPAGGVTARKRR